jgi:hypothetical protein
MTAPETESFTEQLSRVGQMAHDSGDTWDLSLNDQAALRAVLDDRAGLLKALKQIHNWILDGGPVGEGAHPLFIKSYKLTVAAIAKAEGR